MWLIFQNRKIYLVKKIKIEISNKYVFRATKETTIEEYLP
jgi:hypothetical protein